MGESIINKRSMEEYEIKVTIDKHDTSFVEKFIVNDFKSSNKFYERFITPIQMKMDEKEMMKHFDELNFFMLLVLNDLEEKHFYNNEIDIEIKQCETNYCFNIKKISH